MKTMAVAGTILLIVGLVLLGTGAFVWVTGTQSTTNALASNLSGPQVIKHGVFEAISVNLVAGQKLSGTFTQLNGTTTNFYLMNALQQDTFGFCQPCSSASIANISNAQTYSFSWPINTTGTYYLDLDNSQGKSAESVSITASTSDVSSSLGQYEAITVIGVIVAIIGAVIVALSFRKKASPSVKQPATETKTAPMPEDRAPS